MDFYRMRFRRIIMLIIICNLVCFSEAAEATKVTIESFSCWVCKTEFSGPVVHSWYTRFPKPNIEPLKCPRCGAPPKGSRKPQVGIVRDLMKAYLGENGSQIVIQRLVAYCTQDKDVDAWKELILNVDYDSLIADIRDSGPKLDDYLRKNFDAVNLLTAIDTAKTLKSNSKSSERLKNIVISKKWVGYWERIRTTIKTNPSLVDDAINVQKQKRDEQVAELEQFKRAIQGEKFTNDFKVIFKQAKKQIFEQKQKYLNQLKEKMEQRLDNKP